MQGIQCLILEKALKFLSEKPFTKNPQQNQQNVTPTTLLFNTRAADENYMMAQEVFLQLSPHLP